MASDIKLNDNGVVVEGGELHSAGPVGGFSFADRTMGNAGRWVLYAHAGLARLWSQVAGDRVVIHSNGNVGIGTTNPVRPLHVEGNEIHSGGPGAGFSFSDRAKPGFVNNPSSTTGERWVWYANQKYARLWSGIDHIEVRPNVNEPNQPATVVILGDLQVGGRLSADEIHGELRFLTGAPDKAPDGSDIELVSILADTMALTSHGGTRKYFALHANIDRQNNKELLVINHQGGYKDGVKIEGNVQVTGVLTQASSIALKENVAALSGQEAMAALQGLSAVKFAYKADERKEQHVGFIAEDVPDLVATSDRKAVSAMDIVAVLTKVVQEQQKTMADLAAEVSALKARRI
jgi:hypothetical protein